MKYSNIKLGDLLIIKETDCLSDKKPNEVMGKEGSYYVFCKRGKHFLDGCIDNPTLNDEMSTVTLYE